MLAPSATRSASALPLLGRIALVTGGSRGIGRAIALALATRGADVAFTWLSERATADESAAEATDTFQTLEQIGRGAVAVPADGRSTFDVETAVARTFERFGGLDILVNNAGIARDHVVWKMTDDDWADVIDTDLTSCMRYIRAVVPLMRERGGGRIIGISSINAVRGKFGQSNYAAAKAGIIGLSKSVAKEVGRYGITVNVVTPGMIDTKLVAALPEEVRKNALTETALGRLGEPEDVAALVTFLATDDARHITGAVIPVDGGQSL